METSKLQIQFYRVQSCNPDNIIKSKTFPNKCCRLLVSDTDFFVPMLGKQKKTLFIGKSGLRSRIGQNQTIELKDVGVKKTCTGK